MANRSFHRGHAALELEVIHLYAKVTIGATGAPTLVSASSKGVASVTRDSAGQYKVTLQDQYSSLLWCNVQLLTTTSSDATTVGIGVRVEDDQVAATTPYVQVQFYALDDGAVADPANGAVVLVKLELKNSTI